MARADFFVRFVAYVIDNVIIWLVALVPGVLVGGVGSLAEHADSGLLNALAGLLGTTFLALMVIGQFLYHGYFLSTSGQTPGKRVMNIRVTDRQGGNLSFLMGGMRGTLGYWLSGSICSLGFLWALFDNDKETWHDKLFGTVVVHS
ncbi:MAG: RDD family protein [Acidobacteria bacterium]|nr:RDD family protein [Acidobacteriota bacterium]